MRRTAVYRNVELKNIISVKTAIKIYYDLERFSKSGNVYYIVKRKNTPVVICRDDMGDIQIDIFDPETLESLGGEFDFMGYVDKPYVIETTRKDVNCEKF